MSGDFQDEIECLGIEASPSFVREPEGNGGVEGSHPQQVLFQGSDEALCDAYSATEVDGWQHKLSRVSQNRAAVQPGIPTIRVFEALACGVPLICAPWRDEENLFPPGLRVRRRQIIACSLI
jgi:hypothetical protein